MKKAKKFVATAATVTLVGGLLAGCGDSKPAAEGTAAPATTPAATTGGETKSNAKQEITINFSAEPPALDTTMATASAAHNMLNAINEGLYRLDKDGKLTLGLAKDKPKVSEDKLTYTVELRDATWADGVPVKAQDFEYSFKRTADPANKSQYGFFMEFLKGGAAVQRAKDPAEVTAKLADFGVKAINEKTLEIKLERPLAFFDELLAFGLFFPQREDIVKKNTDKNGADADKVIGAGPFKLAKWDHDQSLEFVKNDKYWDAKNVNLEKFTVNIVKDQATGVNLYETKAADVTGVRGDLMKPYEGKKDLKLKPELTNAYLQFQSKKNPALANAKIRTALGLAVDLQAYIDTVSQDGSVPATGLVPVITKDGNGSEFRKVAGDVQGKFDPAKAKALLAEGLKEAGLDKLPALKLLGDDTENAKKTLEFFVSQWKANLGVDIAPEPVVHKLRLERSAKGDFDIVFSLWGGDYNDPMTFLDLFVTDGPFNEGKWSNKTFDEKIKAAGTEKDGAARSKLLVEAEKILVQESGVYPIYFRTRPFLVRENIENLILPLYGNEWELKWVKVK
ncbi:peptide ABC transporter substrate-binding protein [Paenibacillus sp. N1-5-1-14]|uniref:peptide ABC transporter substrate-binding protein n=1 Tax=Paenibacillus radicibacter TaxID=2972488 RepID=UPI002158FA80|nr:peptide ABC transporter substrate-binding protein [Paenibacillus radicibacter]MCR8641934.1 peptide ABC transporter substrate-binding protein [Paenibacillus radicibacter]